MKLLFCGFVQSYGGAQRMQILLANEMVKRGHQVTLLALAGDDLKYTLSEKVELRILSITKGNVVKQLFRRRKIIKQILLEMNPDLIINFWMQPAYLCAFMGKKIARKTIYAERGDPYDIEYTGIRGILRKISFYQIGGFVFQTEGARIFFDEKIREKSTIIVNPLWLNPDEYIQKKIPDKRIVTSGRLHPQKNQKIFIEAIKKLSPQYSEFIAEIYGEGELRSELQKMINSLGLQNRVFLRGAHKDVLDKIKDASVFVLTSDYEGMPNALMEAMALGIPCVATDCRPGGAKALIENNVNGQLVPCGDSNAVAVAIERYLSNSNWAHECGINAKKILEKTNPKMVFDQWENFFLDMKRRVCID